MLKKILVFLFIIYSGCISVQKKENSIGVTYLKLSEVEAGNFIVACNIVNEGYETISHVIFKIKISNDGNDNFIMYRACGNIKSNESLFIKCPIKDYRSMARVKIYSVLFIYPDGDTKEIYGETL